MEKDDSGTILGVYTYGNDLVKMRRDSTDSYYLYGGLVASSGSTENTRKFTGEDYDVTSSLLYLRARYYDPDVGRFISRDSIGVNGGINLYAYCGNNPVNWVDHTGKIPIKGLARGFVS